MATDEKKMGLDAHSADDVETSPSVDAADLHVDPAAEKRLLRKLDTFLAPMMVLFFLVAYLDRSNIGRLPQPILPATDMALTGSHRKCSHCWHDRGPRPHW